MGSCLEDCARFDASQYAFFGKNALGEIELGGLEEVHEDNTRDVGFDDEEVLCPSKNKMEAAALDSLSDLDDLASTFSKLNRTVSEPKDIGIRSGSYPGESFSTADWSQDSDISNWLDPQLLNAENAQDGKRWWSQPYASSSGIRESKPLQRTSSYPYQQTQSHHDDQLKESIPGFKSSLSSHSLHGTISQPSNLTRHLSIPSLDAGLKVPFPALDGPSLFNPNHLTELSRASSYDGSGGQFMSSGLQCNNLEQRHWWSHSSVFPLDRSCLPPNLLQQQLHYSQGLMNTPIFPYKQLPRLHGTPPQCNPLSSHRQFFNQQYSPLQVRGKYEMQPGTSQSREPRTKPRKGKHSLRLSQQNSSPSDTSSQKSDNGVVKPRSKYMTVEDLETVMKSQPAVVRKNDPYIDDYYHLACLEKKSAANGIKTHFCPASIRDTPARGHGSGESQTNVVGDMHGKASKPSVPQPSVVESAGSEQKSSKPLEREPMLAARIIIEDSLRVVLDVDDIDRFLLHGKPQDGGTQLRRRRQILLEGLVASLRLVDPFGTEKMGTAGGIAPADDLLFLRVVALPKGRNLFSRFLQLIPPGSELARIACMTIFRHLRVLFGGLSADASAAQATIHLSRSVALCVHAMDLNALSACLAAVVCSAEQPPLRPLGSRAGDGASVIVKSVLEQATNLLTDPQAASNYSVHTRNFWQASFDDFFDLLTKYCEGKYEKIRRRLVSHEARTEAMGANLTRDINGELPLELLSGSIPHTKEHQRKYLQAFLERAMLPTAKAACGRGGRQTDSKSVHR